MIYLQMFPILQGLEIVNPQAAERKVQAANAKYFSSTSGFHKIKKGDTWRKQCHFLVGSLCASVESVDVYLSTFFIILARSNLCYWYVCGIPDMVLQNCWSLWCNCHMSSYDLFYISPNWNTCIWNKVITMYVLYCQVILLPSSKSSFEGIFTKLK